jgi:hypothetical protein
VYLIYYGIAHNLNAQNMGLQIITECNNAFSFRNPWLQMEISILALQSQVSLNNKL